MSQSEQQKRQQKVIQYLNEAHATEMALTRVLQSQIAMTPRGSYRSALESHLEETRDHAERVQARLRELGEGGDNPLTAGLGFVGSVVGQALAFGKTPFDLLRGSGGEEKVLKNAKDAAATEALEIATYTAIERLATAVGDDETAKLAASIRADEEKMLARVLRELPKLTDAVVRAEVVSQFRGDKIIIFRYKSKVRYRRKTGHRQSLTRLLITDILLDGASSLPPAEAPAEPVAVESLPVAAPDTAEQDPPTPEAQEA